MKDVGEEPCALIAPARFCEGDRTQSLGKDPFLLDRAADEPSLCYALRCLTEAFPPVGVSVYFLRWVCLVSNSAQFGTTIIMVD